MINDKTISDKELSQKPNRLPCRGCTKNCTDYERCDGKPWRLIANSTIRKRVKV